MIGKIFKGKKFVKNELCLILMTLLISSLANALSPEEKGLEIARQSDIKNSGWSDYRVETEMMLKAPSGRQVNRQLRSRAIETKNDGDKSLVIFDSPSDVKGTAFLSFSHKAGDDDQWIYLSSLERVKRISSSNRSGPFMGSEFAYEDILSEEIERYSYRFINQESCFEHNCFVVERYPVDKNSGYSKQIVWYDTDELRIVKIEYYDRKSTLLKTLLQSEFKQFLSQYWKPQRAEMINHQNGKSTIILWKDYQFQTGLNERDFDQNALKRIR